MKKIAMDKKIISIYLVIIFMAIIIRLIMLGISNFSFKYNSLIQIRDNLKNFESEENSFISVSYNR